MKTLLLTALVSATVLSGCATCPEHPNDWHYTARDYHYEPSLRESKNAPNHEHHPAPELRANTPQRGDVMFSRQNRYPVRVDYERLPSRDLGAAYSLDADQHVVTRVTPNQVQNGWLDNPLDTTPHYRDPECYYPSVGVAEGYTDSCKAPQRKKPAPAQTFQRPGQLSAYVEPVVPAPPVMAKPRPQSDNSLLPEAYCFGDMTPEKDNCIWPK